MKNMKKLISMLLVAVMVMAMSLTTFAATGDKKGDDTTLTIKTTAGHTYLVYQMLIGDVSELTADGKGTLANIELGTNNSAADVATFDAAIKKDGEYLTGAELGDAAAAFITGTPIKVVGDGTDIETTVTNGYYVVVDTWTGSVVKDENGKSDSLSRYMVAVVGDTTINPKATTTDIDKNIIDTDTNKALETGDSKKTDTAAIGDVIEYEVTGTVPNMDGYKYYYYVVTDTMSDGLTLNDADNAGFTVTVGTTVLTRGTDYYVYKDGNSFKLAFEDMKNLECATTGAAISIKYTATVNENAEIGLDPNTNTAKLTFSNNPNSSDRHDATPDTPGVPGSGTATGETPDHVTKTYVTELTIKKVDQDGKLLKDAEFTLTGTNLNKVIVSTDTKFVKVADDKIGQGKYYLLNDGTYTLDAPSTAEEGQEGYNANLYAEDGKANYNLVTEVTTLTDKTADNSVSAKTTEEGYIVFTGLNAGTYTLTETKTPTGYTTAAPITFTISAAQDGQTSATEGTAITWASNETKIRLDAANGVFDTIIENVKGNLLPSTGGIGTTIFYVVGTILALGAGVVLVAKRRIAR